MFNKMTKFKAVFLVLLLVVGVFAFSSSLKAQKNEERKTITVQTPPVAAAIPFYWIQENDMLSKFDVKLDIKVSPDHQRGLSLIQKNEIDMLVTGVNVGAKAYNRGIDLKLLNVNIWGIDYLLTNNFKADSWSDLEGKKLCLPLKGGPLDFLARYLLKENDVDPEKIEFVYRPPANGAKLFMAGKIDAIILPEPLVTVAKNKKANLAFDIQNEWGKLHQGDQRIPFVGLFASDNYIKNNPEYTELINGLYMLGIKWVNNNQKEAANLAGEFMSVPPKVIKKSFTRINLDYFTKNETRKLSEVYFEPIKQMYPDMLGGQLPDDGFYY